MSNRGGDRQRRRVRKRHSDILFDDPTGASDFDYDDAFGDEEFDPELLDEDHELRLWATHPALAGAMDDVLDLDE